MTKIVLFFIFPNIFNFFLKLFCVLIKLIIFVEIITMKTAMQEWFDELKSNYPYLADIVYQKGFQKYLEKEKEQIIDAYENGSDHGMDVIEHGLDYFHGEEYYNEKYNQNK